MISIVTGLEILGMVAGGAYLVSRIETTTKANKEAIEATAKANQKAIEQLAELIKQNMKDTKDMIQLSKDYQREILSQEIAHIKDLIAMTSNETREDIKRLEKKSEETNRVKERLFRAEASLKSVHKRLDIEPSVPIGPEE